MKYEKAKKRYNELLELLLKYAREYYIEENPSVSDAVYDSLISELKTIEQAFPDLIDSSSPTQRVAAAASDEFKKVEHRYQMLSLNDVFSTQDIKDWITRTEKLLENQKHEYFMDIKMDGLACSLIYQDGNLIQAVTRGDGFVGEDVTTNVRTINNIPLRLTKTSTFKGSYSGRVEVRGEIIMLKSDFDKLNQSRQKQGLPLFANPRNLAAGTIRQLDPKLVAERPLRFMAWDLIVDEPSLIKTNMMAYEILTKIGIVRNKWAKVAKDIKEIDKFIEHWVNERPNLPFYIDGLVIKINDREQFNKLGIVGKNPRGAVAYKFAAEEATTKIIDIQLSIGRTGAVTPIAVFNPVVIAGTTVRHASIHNSDEIERRDIRIGDTVVIYKAGDIIPQIDRVIKELRPNGTKKYNFEENLKLQYPDLHFKRNKDEAVYRLIAKDAPYLIKKGIEHYASKPALDIDGLGEANVSLLVDSGLIKDIADLYLLKQQDIEKLDRFAELSSTNLIKAINDKKNPVLSKFIFGLGIRHVGAQTAIDLTNRFNTLESLTGATEEELLSIEGVGEIIADSIIKWFADPENEKLLNKLKKVGVEPKSIKVSNKLKGYGIAITGTIEGMSREQIADKIRSLGGKFDSAVNNDTKYLIIGSSPGKSKIDRANALGIEKIDESGLRQLFDNKD